MRKRVHQAAVAVIAGLALAGCGGGGSTDDLSGPEVTPSGAVCDAVAVGPITRCENFYEDFWPTIDANLDQLYEEAKEIDGGRLVVWDWYELSPEVIAAFNARFPEITIETRGLTYNLSSAIITADATGERNTDVVSGTITSMAAMYDEGYWEKVDWTEYGVPEGWLTIGAPELLPDGINGHYVQVNTSKVANVPTGFDAFTSSEWNGKLAVANYNAGVFSGYGMAHGKDAMVELIGQLKSSGNLAVVEDTGSLLSSGDKPVVFGGQLYNPNEQLQVSTLAANTMYVQFSGVNKAATNKPGAALWVLWNAFDPDWLELRMTDEDFASSAVPFPGLPAGVFDQATGLAAKNATPWLQALGSGDIQLETQASRDEWNDLIRAADEALNS